MKGLLEERNPFFSIYLPTNFQNKFPNQYSNFVSNLDRLVTPFDIHETLLDLLFMLKSGNNKDISSSSRVISLFKPISAERTCSDADIDSHWCACLKRKKLMVNDHAIELANAIVEFINNKILSNHLSKCMELQLAKINKIFQLEAFESVRVIKKNKSSVKENFFYKLIKNIIRPVAKEVEVMKNYEQYQIQLETSPNNAIYETTITVERDLKDSYRYSINVDPNLISRLNGYGKQSICIHDEFPDLRKYCFCK